MAPTDVARLNEDVDDKEAIKILQSVAKSAESQPADAIIEGVSKMLTRDNEKIQHLASKTLANLAFEQGAAEKIIKAPELRRSLSNVMKSGKNDAKLEATRALNNCLSRTPDAAQAIALDEDAMNALKSLCSSPDASLRYKGIDTLSNMSAFPAGAKAIEDAGFVDAIVLPVLAEKKGLFGSKDQYDVARFEAFNVLANCDKIHKAGAMSSKDMKLFHSVLKAGLDGKNWAGRSWTPYNALLPMGRMTKVAELHKVFAEVKMVKLLVNCVKTCRTNTELMVACFCLNNLAIHEDCKACMKKDKYDLISHLQRLENSNPEVHPHARAVRKKAFEPATPSAITADANASAAPQDDMVEGNDDSTSDDRTESEDKKDGVVEDPDAEKDN